eukprot:278421-Prymnesium_polylepis.1
MGACLLSEKSAGLVERSSTGCWLPRHDSPRDVWRRFGATEDDIALISRVELLFARACGAPASHGEPAQ